MHFFLYCPPLVYQKSTSMLKIIDKYQSLSSPRKFVLESQFPLGRYGLLKSRGRLLVYRIASMNYELD